MPLDLSGFVSPPDTFEGLDRLSNTLYNQRQQKYHLQKERQAKDAASTKFFANYLDDKEKFTGTKYDPINHQLLSDALTDATGLIRQGADVNDIMAAISPKVNRASQYTLNAQTYAANKKAYIDRLRSGGAKGIDIEKLNSEIDKQAFPEGVDVSKVDPNINYGDMALKNGDVYNTEGFDESFKNAPRNTEVGSIKYTNKKGGIEREKVKLTAPYYAISEKDADKNHIGFVPKFQEATDEGNPLLHQFETEHGKVNAPVRLFDKDLFDAMPPSEKGYLLAETRKYAQQKGVNLDSKQAENFARALAYDEKKARINGTYEHIDETKENPVKIYNIQKETQAEKKAAITRGDLHKGLDETPIDETGRIDVTPFVGGITYLTNSKGKRISQPEVMFNPTDKTFTFKDIETGDKETVSISKFKSMAATSNPATDMGFLEAFKTYNRNSDNKIDKTKEAKGAIDKFMGLIRNVFPSSKKEPKPKATVEHKAKFD